MEDFEFQTDTDEIEFDLDFPLIVSSGVAYAGFTDWIIAADLRYFDYENADGFSDFGWRSVWAFAVGAQYQVSEMWQVRVGYNANQNPIESEDVLANISTPLIQDQNIALGASCHLARCVDMHLSYIYLVENDVTGPLPAGVFGPDATLSNEISAHSFGLGVSVNY
jgi:long-chain fatty acid transport protein